MKFLKIRLMSGVLSLVSLDITSFGATNVFNSNDSKIHSQPNSVHVQGKAYIKCRLDLPTFNIIDHRGAVVLHEQETATRKEFSTASIFFICTLGILIFKYFYSCWEKTLISKPVFSNFMLIIMCIITVIWLILKFPLFIKIETEKLDESYYEKIYVKDIRFLSRLYIVFFEFIKPINMISLFGKIRLSFGARDKNCKFTYTLTPVKIIHRIFDIILTIIACILIFFVEKEISKFGIIFGLLLAVFVILFAYRKALLNYIYSINVGKYGGYRLNVMYPYSSFDGIFSIIYGLAYDMNKTILIHKDVYCGGDILKKYILAHEKGHLETRSTKQSFLLTTVYIISSLVGIAGPTIVSEIWPTKNALTWIPCIFYIGFLIIFNLILSDKTKNDELNADIDAIKVIGKDAILQGLNIIKNDKLYNKIGFKLSGVLIDRRIEFVKNYKEQQKV